MTELATKTETIGPETIGAETIAHIERLDDRLRWNALPVASGDDWKAGTMAGTAGGATVWMATATSSNEAASPLTISAGRP